MRGRSFRMLIFTLLILGLSIAALGFRELDINIPGLPRLERAGTGPLGLKLGLDLRGGGHLVYQADTGTRADVTFSQPVSVESINGALTEGGFTGFETQPRGDRALRIKTSVLDDARRQELRETLEKLGAIESFQVTQVDKPTPEQMEAVVDKIKRRVNLFGTDEPIIQQFGEDRVVVQLPGASGSRTEVAFNEPVDPENLRATLVEMGFEDFQVDPQGDRQFRIQTVSLDATKRQELQRTLEQKFGTINAFEVTGGIEEAKALIGQTARLEFKERTCTDLANDPLCQLNFTDADIGLTGDALESAFASTDPTTGEWVVNITFDGDGKEIFAELTERIVGNNAKRIAVFRDEELLIAPVVRAPIRDGRSQISGAFNREEARTLSIQLQSGRLEVPLKLVQESDVDALLGSESLRKSLVAGVVGLGLVMLFMVVYYRMPGVVASLALVFYAIILLAIFKLIPITLTLSGIAGFVLSIGMAVDANILIFERMKEEMRIGRTLASSMEVGFSRAWPAIRDSNVSTFITCFILLWFGSKLGGEMVTGFALSLLIGVAVSMFTALVVSRNLLQLMAWAGLGRRLNLFTPEPVPSTVRTVAGGR